MLGSLGGGWRDRGHDAAAAAERTPYVVKLSSWNILGADALFRAAVGDGAGHVGGANNDSSDDECDGSGGGGGGELTNTPEVVTAIHEVPWVFIYRDPVEVRYSST